MINFSFDIDNQFRDTSTPYEKQIDYVEYDKPISWWKHKAFSFQVSKGEAYEFFGICFRSSWRAEDHAGIRLHLTFWKWFLVVNLYDTRHWDHDKNDWYNYGG